jgi:hypothetical protein
MAASAITLAPASNSPCEARRKSRLCMWLKIIFPLPLFVF